MPSSRAKSLSVVPVRGAFAGILAALVFALGLFGAAPAAHNWLHAHDANHAVPHDDGGCAVTLFAHGATPPLDLPRAIAPRPVLVSRLVSEPDNLLLTSEPHLTPPGRGPPCIG